MLSLIRTYNSLVGRHALEKMREAVDQVASHGHVPLARPHPVNTNRNRYSLVNIPKKKKVYIYGKPK